MIDVSVWERERQSRKEMELTQRNSMSFREQRRKIQFHHCGEVMYRSAGMSEALINACSGASNAVSAEWIWIYLCMDI